MFLTARGLRVRVGIAASRRPPIPVRRSALLSQRTAHTRPESTPSHALAAHQGNVGKHPFDEMDKGAKAKSTDGAGSGGGGGSQGRGGTGKAAKSHDDLADPMAGPSGRTRREKPTDSSSEQPLKAGKEEGALHGGEKGQENKSRKDAADMNGGGAAKSGGAEQNESASSIGGAEGTASTMPTLTLPTPPDDVRVRPAPPHPFDTYAFVAALGAGGLSPITSRTLMEAVRKMVTARSERARGSMLSREEADNDAYRFKAALANIRAGHSVQSRRDGEALRSAATALRREVDSLDRQIKEDIADLRHDVDMDVSNRKDETRAELKRFDMAREEIKNKFTISLGDLRTEIEGAKWDATRRAIAIIISLVILGVAISSFNIGGAPETPPEPEPAPEPKPAMVDASVGTDDHEGQYQDRLMSDAEEHVDRLLGSLGSERRWREAHRAIDAPEPQQRQPS